MTRRTSRGSSTSAPATRRHWFARLRRRETCEQCGKTSRREYCDVCGYDLVRRTRDAAPKVPNV
jgi:hypothetical protein